LSRFSAIRSSADPLVHQHADDSEDLSIRSFDLLHKSIFRGLICDELRERNIFGVSNPALKMWFVRRFIDKQRERERERERGAERWTEGQRASAFGQ